MRFCVTVLFCLLSTSCFCQSNTNDWHEALRQWMTAEDMEESYGEETLEWLEERAATKINLNQTTREELEELPFLTAAQVEAVVAYIDRYGPVKSLSELQMITALGYETHRLLACFVEAGPEKPKSPWPSMRDVAKYGKHTLMVTGKIPLYQRKGDSNGYLGYPYRHDVRYQFTYGSRIKFGITGAQDAGEPFFSGGNPMGYDQYNYYFQLRNTGAIESLNLGMYRVQMGMGLVMNTGFHLGKLSVLQTLGRSSHTLTAHSSRSSQGCLQGAAATLQLSPRWQLTAFASYLPVDATLNDDGTARTLLTDGYHRTPTEMGKKHNTNRTDLGFSAGFRPALKKGVVHVNVNAVYTHFDRALQPQTNVLYRRYAATGNDFLNVSVDYGYTDSRLTMSGETAMNANGAMALIHTVSYRLTDELTLMALHRYYDKRYTALHARSFGEGSSVQNEHGVYVAATWQPSRSWLVQGYADYAHFPWARYLVTAPSDVVDVSLTSRYTGKTWTLEGRYRYHVRQRDNSSKTMLENRPEHRLRLRADLHAADNWSLQSQAEGILARSAGGADASGIMLSEQASWQNRWLKVNALAGWFHTQNYDSRLYLYERSVQHDFASTMLYGHGIRYALMLQAHVGQQLTATAKCGVTNYFDRSVIGSGLQQIARSSMADVLVQLKYRF